MLVQQQSRIKEHINLDWNFKKIKKIIDIKGSTKLKTRV